MKVEEYKMREDEVPEVWRIVDMTDDDLVNTDQIIQNWLYEVEQMQIGSSDLIEVNQKNRRLSE